MTHKCKKGESIVEILLAMAIFSLAAISTISAMNFGLHSAQADLEITQARTELDAQAESLRFIQNGYISSGAKGSEDNPYSSLWGAIMASAEANNPKIYPNIYTKNGDSYNFVAPTYSVCSDVYNPSSEYSLEKYHAFAINPRILAQDSTSADAFINSGFNLASTYPRLIYNDDNNNDTDITTKTTYKNNSFASTIEGIWVYGIPAYPKNPNSSLYDYDAAPEYVDFYINTCWYPQGISHVQTINTTIRLYNPNSIQSIEKESFYVTFFYKNNSGSWTKEARLTSAIKRGEGKLTINIPSIPDDVGTATGTMFTGWMPVSTDLTSMNDAFYNELKSSKTFIGSLCSTAELANPSLFRPECKYTQASTDSNISTAGYINSDYIHTGMNDIKNINIVMVEKPPMDIAVVLDGSGSMPQEIAGVRNGLNNLANYVLGETIGKMSLTFLRQSGNSANGANYYDLCSLGYRGLGGTCGANSGATYQFNSIVNSINQGANANWQLVGSSSPEYLSYNAVMEKVLSLANSSEPAYNKMVILVTDTVPTDVALSRFRSTYPSQCASFSNCSSYDNVQKVIGRVASENRIHIYVIESYANGQKINGRDVGSAGDNTTVSRVNTAWSTMTSLSHGAIIDARAALGDYRSNTFAGSDFSYDYNTGKLHIKSYNFNKQIYVESDYGSNF